MRRWTSIVAIGLMAAVPVTAQATIAGKWQGQTNGGASVVLELTLKGTSLTGTLTRNDQSTPITDGKVSDETFTFNAKLNETVEGFSGERSGDQLKVWLDRQGRETAILLQRVKPAPKR
jgi:hypothetical protein